jgi:predicted AAA+ superfamily ATPase
MDHLDTDALLAAVAGVYGEARNLLLDEIQNVPSWELVVNRLQRAGHRLTITGSNAHLLSSELATHLTGRYLPIVVLPFSFPECLASRGAGLTAAEQAELFRGYAEDGGYPEPLLKDLERRSYLGTLLHAVLHKDIVLRHDLRSPQGLSDLAGYLASNLAREYSLNALTQVTRCRSIHTVAKYLGYLEEALLFFTIPRFSFKARARATSNRKAYCIDNGLAAATAVRFSADTGPRLENLVAIALYKETLVGATELFYWRSPQGEEIDFVVKRGPRIEQLIQVTARIDDPRTLKREVRSLLKARDQLRCDDLLILHDGPEPEFDPPSSEQLASVRLLPLWKWLLSRV